LDDACAKYAAALEITPQSSQALRNWGVALNKKARATKSSEAAEKLFIEAEEKFKRCLEFRPNDFEVYFNWGNVSYHRARRAAKLRKFQDAFQHLITAQERYMAALESNPNNNDALINWGKVLDFQSGFSKKDQPSSYSLPFAVKYYLAMMFTAATKRKLIF
jgi:tetratricopeptide (TPR) repeat protein